MTPSPMRALWVLFKPSSRWLKRLDPVRPKTWVGRMNGAFLVGVGLLFLFLFNVPFYGAYKANQALMGVDGKAVDSWLLGGTLEALESWKKQATGFDQQALMEHVEASALSQLRGVNPWLLSVQASQRHQPLVWLEAPLQFKAPVKASLQEEGFEVNEEKCPSCIALVWKGRGWTYQLDENQDQKGKAILGLQRALKHTEKTVASTLAIPVVALDESEVAGHVHALGLLSLQFGIHAAIVLLAWGMVGSTSHVGIRWDRERSKGTLEPWVSAFHPPWVLYGAQIAKSTAVVTAALLAVIATAWAWGLPLHWKLLLATLVWLPVGCLFVGLWGMLATVLFHHRNGRRFSRLVFSPALLMLAWSIRVAVVWSAMKASNPEQAYAYMKVFLNEAWWVILLSVPLFGLLAWALFWAVERRMGTRRTGLRACA